MFTDELSVMLYSGALGINTEMTKVDDSFRYTFNNRIFITDNFFTVKINNQITYEFSNVNCFYDITDILMVKSFKKSDNEYYIINLPLIEKNEMSRDFDFYMDKFLKMFYDHNINRNRMTSDDIELRLLNSYFVPKDVVQQLTYQQYDFDIQLPLKVHCEIVINRSFVIDNSLNLENEIEYIKHHIASTLLENYTGTQLIFYHSKLVDLTHDIEWIKSVKFIITDSLGTEIPNGNIETYNNKSAINILDKFLLIDYSPIYWHWDINNIDVEYVLDNL
jgi:hypothetical protein